MRRMRGLASLVFVLSAVARADDAALFESGAPRIMSGETTVRMVREDVRMTVYPRYALVTCRFVFKNEGPPTVVKLGFPDYRQDGEDPDYDLEPRLTHFRSRVDGKEVRVKFEGNPKTFENFHVKHVRFGRGQVRLVEDSYASELGSGGTSSFLTKQDNAYIKNAHYAMYSGASWHGTIARAKVVVDMSHYKPHWHPRITNMGDIDPWGDYWSDPAHGPIVLASGFSKPRVSGSKVTFYAENLKPTGDDDIDLYFDPRLGADLEWNKALKPKSIVKPKRLVRSGARAPV